MANKKTKQKHAGISVEEYNLIKEPAKSTMTMVEYLHHGLYGSFFDKQIENHQKVFNSALNRWTDRDFLNSGFCENVFRFYDNLIGSVIANGNNNYQNKIDGTAWANPIVLKFLDVWKYDGMLYRVLDIKPHKVVYHNMISSWAKNVDVFDEFIDKGNLLTNTEYTFLIANTRGYFGFDVNKYRTYIRDKHTYTEYEDEIIFPMNREFITDVFYGTLEDFKKYVKANQV